MGFKVQGIYSCKTKMKQCVLTAPQHRTLEKTMDALCDPEKYRKIIMVEKLIMKYINMTFELQYDI